MCLLTLLGVAKLLSQYPHWNLASLLPPSAKPVLCTVSVHVYCFISPVLVVVDTKFSLDLELDKLWICVGLLMVVLTTCFVEELEGDFMLSMLTK